MLLYYQSTDGQGFHDVQILADDIGRESYFATGDIDKDGRDDIVLVSQVRSILWVFYNEGVNVQSLYPQWNVVPVDTSANAYGVALGDLTGNEKLDIVTGKDALVVVYANEDTADPNPFQKHPFPEQGGEWSFLRECERLKVWDVDQDGLVDVLAACGFGLDWMKHVRTGPDDTTLLQTDEFLVPEGTDIYNFLLEDMNGDGIEDIVLSYRYSVEKIIVYYGSFEDDPKTLSSTEGEATIPPTLPSTEGEPVIPPTHELERNGVVFERDSAVQRKSIFCCVVILLLAMWNEL